VEPLRHRDLGHVILRGAECEAFVGYLQKLDAATLLSTGRDSAWRFERTGYEQDEWKRDQCRIEWRRRAAEAGS
jgi:hypothetical protein